MPREKPAKRKPANPGLNRLLDEITAAQQRVHEARAKRFRSKANAAEAIRIAAEALKKTRRKK